MIDLVTENLPLITSAPDGIKRLRGLILELAVRGKLVPQDPADEPASELLMRIEAEKARLVKEGKIRKPKVVEPVGVDERPFEVPVSWKWARFGEVTICRDGERVPVSRDEREQRAKLYDYYGASGVIDKIDGYLFDKPLLLIGEDGANLINRSTPIAFIARGKYWVNNHAHVIDGLSEEFLLFVELCINATDLKPYVTGTAQPKMNQEKLNSIPIALPPLPEQHRIAARVDELMALCDRLEAEQTDAADAHARLVDALLATLTTSRDAAECAANWQRLSEHYDTLFTTEASIAALKQTVLQLAVMGRLVPQDPTCETPTRISEKIISNPQTCEIPPNWQIATLGALCEVCGGMTPTKSRDDYWGDGMPWVSPKDMKANFITDAQDHITERALSETTIRPIQRGSLLVVVRGMILAHSFPVAIARVEVTINQDMKALIPSVSAFAPYLMLVCKGFKKDILNLVERSSHGTCKLETRKLLNFPFGLPPLPEQHRIVAKVDELMVLCDRLKADLQSAHACESRISEALTTIR